MQVPSTAAVATPAVELRAVGFCGVDDSVRPYRLVTIAHLYPWVEFGVLFRPGREGTPRYPTEAWVDGLCRAVRHQRRHVEAATDPSEARAEELFRSMHPHHRNAPSASKRATLAAHLCGTRVDEVLRGNDDFVRKLSETGCFGRIQINATSTNGVDVSVFATPESAENAALAVSHVVGKHPNLEFIVQQNEETRPLWETLLTLGVGRRGGDGAFANLSFLLDESKGTGVLPPEWPTVPSEIARGGFAVGYAGGIGPSNVGTVLDRIVSSAAASGRSTVWIDMESSLRSSRPNETTTTTTTTADVFDLTKCHAVLEAICARGYCSHPPFLGG